MGNQMSKEEKLVLSTWKHFLKRKGVTVEDYDLQHLLLWCRKKGFEANTSVAFRVKTWENVGDKLWKEVYKGAKSAKEVEGLPATWHILVETLKDWLNEQVSEGIQLPETEPLSDTEGLEREEGTSVAAASPPATSPSDNELIALADKKETVWRSDTHTKKSTKSPALKTPKGLKVHYPAPHNPVKTLCKYKSPTAIVPYRYNTPVELVEEFKAKQRQVSSVPPPQEEEEEEEDENTDENNEDAPPADDADKEEAENASVCSRALQSVRKGSQSRKTRTLSDPWTLPAVTTVTVMPRHPRRCHTSLPGFFTEGNARADSLVASAQIGPVPDKRQQALLSHQFFHQGSTALKRQLGISQSLARSIVAACPDCQSQNVLVYYGVYQVF
ncbi:uncharacterized protein LOC120323249 [Pipra filicauda]|uniref:Uncharacterized protein LOC120323249 n=1 Tax=Pipra filicauda TaxID=649802 RepID=A0A7R5KA66_9PASS|nr:uncharacterized protein LOC120323249 [Pipra filicauda]